ncbi:TadE/TadG family type IV pilus assembly protein [Microbacterium sp.]|uniref:TadE/TadG family type IV pilus assembly protein n=1 Tax=Microbacterium sp. TaxID=51671 RepID=UPI003A84EA3C
MADDEGTASLEFILVGVVMLVPLVYLVVTLGLIQGQALGVEAAARHTARAVATASGVDAADERAERILAAVADEYGIDPATMQVDVSCVGGGPCPAAGQTLTVTVTASVALPLVPPVLGLDRAARVPIEAMSVQKVSRAWTG